MNVPVISLEDFFNSRTKFFNSDLKDLVAKNKDDYISKNITLMTQCFENLFLMKL